MNNTCTQREKQEGIALLITLLLMGVLLSIGASLMNITLKQYQFAGIAFASEVAFQAANAGLECVLYYDKNVDSVPDVSTDLLTLGVQSVFDVPTSGEQSTQPSIDCMSQVSLSDDNSNGVYNDSNDTNGLAINGGEQVFQFTFGNPSPDLCSEVSIYKFNATAVDMPVLVHGVNMWKGGGDCSLGICTVIQARGYNVPCSEVGTNPRVVEREYTQVY